MPATDDQEKDPFEGLKLDEDFIQGAEHKEQSARARMLSARWKHTPPQDTGWRAPVTPIRRRRRWQVPVFMVLAAGLVLASLNARALHDWALGKAPGAQAADNVQAAQAPETALPTAAPPTAADPTTPTLEHPFAGSPADAWPAGAAAITVPSAHAVGVYSASTVAEYLARAKEFLVDSNLSPDVVGGGYPSAALGLIDPLETQLVDPLRTDLAHPSAKNDPTDMFTRFNPDQARLIGSVIKVEGELSYASDGQGGLNIHADVTFVYPLQPGPHPAPWLTASPSASGAAVQASLTDTPDDWDVARSIIRRIVDFDVPDATHWQHTPGKLWITNYTPDIGNSACGVSNGYINPEFPSVANMDTATPSGPAEDPYDRSKLPDTKRQGCGQLSRT
ncbi:SCO2583/SCO2584 N-terminal domain-containing protein [Streptacidiphilus fuscans]|uniref:Uncharacterized protein n=1 Tax=Streptacidiphilus fuscans TaxID=2789292 RepID=A0A931FHD7_9ACTN|nr:hypothetical protein [Streptacidiphilus fuscans]MBF9073503.1 hypothetical protein [Streptacidiphilus fuscans]